ncbi:CD320 antigen isoform X2 [Dermochelys coriacea]|uniref:CD320 antigen isoform X2 n=1 Tax=Dermochelys coriacea TaxID=27794 RepID=UPI0018E729B7|nr:CD320 antigen isoform X2 [Dermochelys coriacea]
MWALLALLLRQLVAAGLKSPAGNASVLPCSPRAGPCWTSAHVRSLPQERFCDGRSDCPDGADESAEACQHWGVPPAPVCPCLFQCAEGAECFPSAWGCDGHADCEDGQDERGCGPDSPGASLAPSTARAENPTISKPGKLVLSETQGTLWVIAAFVLLSVLVAAGCSVRWGQFRAKNNFSTFSLEKASKEQLVPDRRPSDSFP